MLLTLFFAVWAFYAGWTALAVVRQVKRGEELDYGNVLLAGFSLLCGVFYVLFTDEMNALVAFLP